MTQLFVLDNPAVEHILPDPAVVDVPSCNGTLMEECEKQLEFYKAVFVSKSHWNYVCADSFRGPLAISIVEEDPADTAHKGFISKPAGYYALIRSKDGWQRVHLPYAAVTQPMFRKWLQLRPTQAMILESVDRAASLVSIVGASKRPENETELRRIPIKHLRLSHTPGLVDELIALESKQMVKHYKFGIGYLKSGQTTESDMFHNLNGKIFICMLMLMAWLEDTSPAFQEFLQFLGDRVRLKGWDKYRAGLDVNNDQAGTHSIYTEWNNYEIMFHIIPWMPYRNGNAQQVDRKRYFGNDICVILFLDPDAKFVLSTLESLPGNQYT